LTLWFFIEQNRAALSSQACWTGSSAGLTLRVALARKLS